MASETMLDLKAMEVNRNIAGRIYWKERLSDLEFNTYFNSRSQGTIAGGSAVYKDYTVTASGEILSKVNKIGGSDRAKQVVLLSALGVFAYKCALCTDVCIFTNLASEGSDPGRAGNIFPVRMKGFAGVGFRDFLTVLRDNIRDDIKYSNYPVEKILGENRLKLDEIPTTGAVMDGIDKTDLFDQFELDILFCFSIKDSLTLSIRYNANKYDAEYIMFLPELYFELLYKLICNPEEDIANIELISVQQKQKILEDFNNTGREYPGEKPVVRLFEEVVTNVPDQVAIEFNSRRMSFQELNAEANKLAYFLVKQGVQPGMPIAIFLERSPDFIIGVLAVLKAGCAYLPIDPAYPDERINYIFDDSRVRYVLTKMSLVSDRSIPSMPEPVYLESAKAEFSEYAVLNPPLAGNDNVYVIYTSGSTGKPKGVIGTQTGLLNRLYWGWERYPYAGTEVCCQKTSLGFVDHVVEMFSPLLKGIPLVILKDKEVIDLDKMVKLLIGKKISRITLVPSLLQALIEWKLGNHTDIPSLRYVFCSGENLPFQLAKMFYSAFDQTHLINIYGSTEVSADVTYYDVVAEYDQQNEVMYIGKPIFNTQILIVDNNNKLTPIGMPGEILISGDGISIGYLNSQELSAEKIIQNPFFKDAKAFKSGDLGRWHADGNIEFLGRLDDQVKIRGMRIRLNEIESLLLTYDKIEKVAVVVKGKGDDEHLVCYYISDAGVKADDIRRYLLDRVPAYMVPSYYVELDSFPLSPNGKTDRKGLPDPEVKSKEDYIAPSNELERKLLEIWAEILKLDTEVISVGSSFFELGGHSISAMALVNRIHAELKIDISIKDVFERKNILNLCPLLRTAKKYTHSLLRKAESREYYNLSIAQKRLYYLSELDKLSLTFNLPSVVKLKGILDKNKMRRAFGRLIERHESLRTSVRIVKNEPVQLVSEQVEFEIEYFNSTEEEADLIIGNFIRPFDLIVAPLFRVGLIEINPEVNFLMVDMHHIISDGTSLGLLINDFMSLYNDLMLPHLDLDYKDYAVWQQSRAYKYKIDKQKDFWIREFSEPIVPLDIPLDFSGSSSTEGDGVMFYLGKEESRKLRGIAEKEVATISMVILSILTVLLSKISGQDDIVVGIAVAGREQFELESMIGMFPVVLPLRTYPKAGLCFREFLDSLKSTFLETFDNQSYQYEDLAKELNLERSSNRNPWFDVLYLYQNFERSELSFPDLQISPYKEQNIVAYEKINLTVREMEERILFRFIYSTALFKKGTIERFAGYFKKITQAVIESMGVKISDIEILGDDEKRHSMNSFDGKADIDRSKSFSDLFREQVVKTPSRIAVQHNGTTLTYEFLYDSSIRLGAHFIRQGLSAGRNVAIFMPRGTEMLKSIIAAFHCGSAYVPIDIDFPGQRVREILSESEAQIVVTTQEMLPIINELKISIPSLQKIVLSDQLDDIDPATDNEVQKSTNDLAYIIYTSGTTGKPKGVVIHQLGMINHLYALIEVLGLNDGDVIAQTASPCFDISVWQFLAALIIGGRTYIIDKEKIREPELLIQTLQEGNVSIFQSVPSLLTAFLDNLPRRMDIALPNLRWMIPTGEMLTVPLVKKWYSYYPDIPLLNAYGPAEASDDVTTYVVQYPSEGQLSIPIGQSVRNMRVYILNESLKLCPVGVKGEICIAGIGVGKGYWKDEDKTREVFVANPFGNGDGDPDYATLYKTGDIGYYLEDGNIICLGRRDDQVKIRGFRIELGEIAGWLLKYPSIREAVVLVKNREGDKYLVAYYVADKEISVTELVSYLSDHLPYYMIPSYFIHLNQLPLTINAKLDKRLLPDVEIRAGDEYLAPSNPIEKKLVEVWARILTSDTKKISVSANFFSFGGHSLNAITLISEVHKEFGVKIPLKDFFYRPTIAFMARYIEKFYVPTEILADVTCL